MHPIVSSEATAEGETTMEDDLPTEYDVVVVGTGIDFYHEGGDGRTRRVRQ